ncbi:MAG TPA: hypothetical protein VLW75_11060 [Rhizomicrobium sp.]|nr:hypothetical protein [Rhizomicrobium sp.]
MRRLAFRAAVLAITIMLAAAGFVAASVFLFVALYAGLASFFSPPVAALICAAAAIFFALVVLFIGGIAGPRRRKKDDSALLLGELLGEQVRDLTSASPTQRLLIALAAGFAVGLSPRLRKIIAGML